MSIHRRGESWVVSYWENGRQRNKFFGARRHGSSEIALQAAQDWQDQRKLSIPDPNAALTLRDLVFIYLQSRPELHRRTKEAIARALRGPAASFADKVADQLTRADLETLRQAARQGGAGPNTINKQQAYIRAALAWGVEQGHLNINPWGGFKRLKAPRYQMQATLEDFRRIVKVAPDWMAWALAVCYSTAARWGLVELFGLRWTAFDWRAGTVGIVQGKTGRPKVVPVSQSFLAEAWRRF